ncbi:hypothetical protein PPIS_b0919 [Pseudoalteromonas piscicida]|uniref:Uncharacterized protein n=1 Tax=Pseudoalteromonas piscicida TaxID=43662 RepID=A0ABN5CK43_PSEO7|nr:hypothetical protein PPIS_b0919 [Pseudoalteromonas piscicida]
MSGLVQANGVAVEFICCVYCSTELKLRNRLCLKSVKNNRSVSIGQIKATPLRKIIAIVRLKSAV